MITGSIRRIKEKGGWKITEITRFEACCPLYTDAILSAAKQISFASALVSMLSLEPAMLNAFGDGDTPSFRFTMTAVTGAAVCVTVLGLAIHMLVRSTKKLKQENDNR